MPKKCPRVFKVSVAPFLVRLPDWVESEAQVDDAVLEAIMSEGDMQAAVLENILCAPATANERKKMDAPVRMEE